MAKRPIPDHIKARIVETWKRLAMAAWLRVTGVDA